MMRSGLQSISQNGEVVCMNASLRRKQTTIRASDYLTIMNKEPVLFNCSVRFFH